jgi:D-alanyl-D-alanine carboxypeptidase/D-alanyl-D-alanine-endopeptidase (penicillin-binding protein 4)
MGLVRTLVAGLTLLIALPTVEAQPGRSRPAPVVKRQNRARPRPPLAKKPAPPKTQARTSSLIQKRPSPLDLSSGAERGKNLAPEGATELERELQAKLDAVLSQTVLKSSINGVYVVDATSGKELYSYGADRQLNPASNTKLISTATALDLLGGDYTYVTRLVGPQPEADGTVPGDVILLGSGDPTLRVKHLEDLVTDLLSRGVHRIAGDVVISSDDRDAVAHPFVRVAVRGAARPGEAPSVSLSPDNGLFVVDNRAATAPALKGKRRNRNRLSVGATLIETTDGPRIKIRVAGKIPARHYVESVRGIPRPVLYTAHTLRAKLIEAGIEVAGGVDQRKERPQPLLDSVELARHDSAPLRELAAMINKPSDNFLADRLLMTVGAEKFGGDRSMEKGVEAMSEWLGGIGVEGNYRLENGSGLSHTIHISARQIVKVLLAGARDERYGEEWLDSLAVAGEDGTLRRRYAGRDSAGFLRGKTGTLNGVAALSGFVTLADDTEVCFAILSSGFRNRSKNAVREAQTEITDAIYEYLRLRMGERAPSEPAPDPDL